MSADWKSTSDFYQLLTNASGEQAYPITATVFVLMPKSASRARTRAVLDFFQSSLEKGSGTAARMSFVPLPAFLITQIKEYWARMDLARRRHESSRP